LGDLEGKSDVGLRVTVPVTPQTLRFKPFSPVIIFEKNVTGSQIIWLKYTKLKFGGDPPQTLLGELTTLPLTPSWLEEGHLTSTLTLTRPLDLFTLTPLAF